MINPNFLTNELAEKMAGEVVKFHVAAEAGKILRQLMVNELKEALKEDDKKQAHDALFNALFKAINPYEKKFEAMLKRIWDEERRIIAANLKKMKKAWLQKDAVDDILYPVAIFEKKLGIGANGIFMEIMTTEGPRVVSLNDFDMIFDVNDPEVQKWLKSYTPKFGKSLEKVSVAKLRKELIEGMNAGEGVYELQSRVYETYKDWGFKRAKTIAQNQVIRASNKAALNVYRQSGVVKKKIWITYFDARTCFPGDVKIITDKGKRKIRTIKKGDIVLTHNGWQKVKEIMNREYLGNLIKIQTSDKKKLVMTEGHPVYEINKGWTEARELIIGSKLKTCENKVVNVISIQNIKLFNSYYSISKFFKFFISPNIFQWIRVPVFSINLKTNVNHWKEKIYTTLSSFPVIKSLDLIFLNKIDFKLFKCFSNCFFYRGFTRIFSITGKRAELSNLFFPRPNPKSFFTMKTIDINRRTAAFLRTMFSIVSSRPKDFSTFPASFINCEFSFAGKATKSISKTNGLINSERFFAANANYSNLFRSLSAFFRTKILFNSTTPNIKFFTTLFTKFKSTRSSGFMITMRRAKKRVVRFLNLIFRSKFFVTMFTYIHDLYKYINILIQTSQSNIVYNLEIENTHTYYANGILVHNCSSCELLDGKIIGLEENYFSKGDPDEVIEQDGQKFTFKNDYEDIDAPPRHVSCRCSISAYIED